MSEEMKNVEKNENEEAVVATKPNIKDNVKDFFKKNGKKIAAAVVGAVGLGAAYAFGVKKGSGNSEESNDFVEADNEDNDEESTEE